MSSASSVSTVMVSLILRRVVDTREAQLRVRVKCRNVSYSLHSASLYKLKVQGFSQCVALSTMTEEPAINPQVAIPKDRVAPLDPKLYDPTPETLVFLKDTVTSDEDELRARVEEVQNE